MIIPVKCFTCGTLISDKYRFYLEQVEKEKKRQGLSSEPVYFSEGQKEKSVEGHMLDKLRMNKQCCRRHFLTHVDIE